MRFDLCTEDILQAYLNSASELLLQVYLMPNRQLKVLVEYVFKLSRPLKHLAHSRDYWYASFANYLTHDLGMNAVSSDMSLFFRGTRGKVTRLLASYDVDTLACVDRSFAELTEKTREAFEVKSREHYTMRSSDLDVKNLSDGFEIHQCAYIDRLKKLPRDVDFVQTRRSRSLLSWLVQSRADTCVIASKHA